MGETVKASVARVRQTEFAEKWQVCAESNARGVTGGTAEALRGADVCIAFACSDPGLIKPDWVKSMAKDAIVFACANPLPEIWPWEAKDAGARIVGTGRGDFRNQINNSLGFPAIFRGTLDVRAHHHRRNGHRRCSRISSVRGGTRDSRGGHHSAHG